MYFESFTQRDTKLNVQGLNPHLMSALVNNFNLAVPSFVFTPTKTGKGD